MRSPGAGILSRIEFLTAQTSTLWVVLALVGACSLQVAMTIWPSLIWAEPGLKAYDRAARTYSDQNVIGGDLRVAFVDMDQKTYDELGSPPVTPNAAIADILQKLSKTAVMAMVVDIDIAFEWNDADGAALFNVLKDYPATGSAPIIFIREMPQPNKPLRPTRYDALVKANPNLTWASALVQPDADGSVRSFAMPVTCGGNGPIVPEARNVLAAYTAAQGIGRQMPVEQSCTKADQSRKFVYSFAGRKQPEGPPAMVTLAGRAYPVFQRVSASDVLRAPDLSTQAFQSAFIVVGNSYVESQDRHVTPFGIRPGAVILANALYSDVTRGPIYEPGLLMKLAIALGASLVPVGIFWAFRRLRKRPGVSSLLWPTVPTLATAFAMFLMWYLVTPTLLYLHNIWVDFAAPQFATALLLLGEEVSQFVLKVRKSWSQSPGEEEML